MAKKPVKIWFIIWPDGQMFEGTQTSVSEARAVGNAVRTWDGTQQGVSICAIEEDDDGPGKQPC